MLISRHMEAVKKGDIIESIQITDAVQDKSLARIDSLVTFIEGGVPGDVADIQITSLKKNLAEARIVKLRKASPDRLEPFCSHFGTCGGCKWQHMSYERQLHFKQKHVVETLERIGKVVLPEILPILGSKEIRYYRNRLDFAFSNKRWLTKDEMASESAVHGDALGFHVPQRFDKIIDIETCYLQEDLSNQIRREIKSFAIKNRMSFFDPVEQRGLLRNLIIRSTSTGEWMVILVFHEDHSTARVLILDHVSEIFPQITSLNYVINPKPNDTIYDLPVHTYAGREFIMEEMEGLQFKISPKSFYQTNSLQAYELYKVARNFAGLRGNELVYDLYTGTGTIANFVAKQARHVIGIEQVADAIADAKGNARLNGITNTGFFAGDLNKTLNDSFLAMHGKPSVIITDPPRAGMPGDVVRKILEIKPERVVYVSCNPATQARDIQLLDELYKVISVQPVDMFPHTSHVENVILLTLRT